MDDELETTEEAFDNIPAEVQQYIYGGEFKKALADLFNAIGLPTEKQNEFTGGLFEYIAQIETKDDLDDMIKEMVPDQANQQKVQLWIQTYIVEKIFSLIDTQIVFDGYEEQDEAESVQTSTTSAPTTAIPASTASLSTLAERLKQASIATPARSDYTDAPQNPPSAPNEPSGSIDPYREPVDNV